MNFSRSNSGTSSSISAVANFRSAIADAGLGDPGTVDADGEIHRFHVEGDRAGTRNGWFVLYIDRVAAGAFGSWRTGETRTWSSAFKGQQTPAERARIRRMVEKAKAKRDAEVKATQATAATQAIDTLKRSRPASPDQAYLLIKNIRPHRVRQLWQNLLLPVYIKDRVCSLQTIKPSGVKRFLSGGKTKGGYFRIDDETRRPEILITEGFATGATLHEETGAAVYVGFNADNLLPVARYIRALHPSGEIIVAADNDTWTPGNPGLPKGRAAALAIGAKLLVPNFTGMDVSGKPTDFNDWFALRHKSRRAA